MELKNATADGYSGTKGFYPEMGEKRPVCDGEVSMSYNGKHEFICTPLELPTGRSVKFIKKYRSDELTKAGQRKVGWNLYQATDRGFEMLKKEYSFSREALL